MAIKKVFNDLNEVINNIKNNKTKKNSTVKKIRNIVFDLDQLREKESTVFQNKMIDVLYCLFNSLGISSEPSRSMLPKWVDISEKRFNEILSTVIKAKNEGLRTNVDGRKITLDNVESLLKHVDNGLVSGHEFKNRYNNIGDDVKAIVDKSTITRSRKKIVRMMSLLREIIKTKFDEQPDITDMPELESEESAAEKEINKDKDLKY